jgi:spoIIIJ-associated protein
MSQEKTTLEIIAPTVEEAVQNGSSQLGLPIEALEVEVLDAGSKGLFGLGGRQARVRLSIKVSEAAAKPVQAVKTTPEPDLDEEPEEEYLEETDEALSVSRKVVEDLLNKMKVRAQVKAMYLEQESEEEPILLVDVQGTDLSILIGRRSETLNALQYIANLIVGKQLGRWVPLVIDIQGYRSRRERQLRQLARRMADQAIHTNRRQILEPMPANERRLIHLELRDHPSVTTQSVGEEPYRKVSIFVKKS